MIARLTGKLLESHLTEVVIDVNGIGFSVSTPLSTFEKLPKVGGEVSLYTVMQVREDSMQLFGFATKEERTLFNLLTATVSGIGAKLALNVLSCISIDGFINAISGSDIKALSKINGIGKRTAERMVLELKDKINVLGSTATAAAKGLQGVVSQAALDATAALETLGLKRADAEKAVHAIAAEHQDFTAEQLIKRALAALNS